MAPQELPIRPLGRMFDWKPIVVSVIALAWIAGAAQAEPPPATNSGEPSLAEIGAKLSNPVSDTRALFTQFGLTFNDGDANLGDPKLGGNMIFQPVLPVPLYGKDEKAWKLIGAPGDSGRVPSAQACCVRHVQA